MRIINPNDPTTMGKVLRTIRTLESGGNYQAYAKGSMKGTASGAYAMLDSTWRTYAARIVGASAYQRAKDAPPHVQDAVAMVMLHDVLSRYHNDLEAVPAVWYTGQYNPATLDVVPKPEYGNRLTVRQYQRKWLTTFDDGKLANPLQSPAGYVSWNEGTKIPDWLWTYGAGKVDRGLMVDIGQGMRLAPEPAKAFARLKAGAIAAGFNPSVTDAYRSFAAQEAEFYRRYTPTGQTRSDRYYQGQWWRKLPNVAQLATPGESVHNFGYALDIFDASKTRTPALHAWLAQHAAEYGFKNTVASESWHFAYQGAGDAGSIASVSGAGAPPLGEGFTVFDLDGVTFQSRSQQSVQTGAVGFGVEGTPDTSLVEVDGVTFNAPGLKTRQVKVG